MREFSTPTAVRVPAGANLTDMVYDNAERHPGAISISRKVDGTWEDLTADRFAAEVTALAGGLVAAGIAPGDRVALMSRTRCEWTLFDYAIWAAGAVTVPVYHTASAEQVRWILADSGAVAAVVETAEQHRALDSVRADLPDLGAVWQLERAAVHTVVGLGARRRDAEVADRRSRLDTDELATIIYTSGTTGRPKGCELTHRNLLTAVLTLKPALRTLFNDTTSTLLFLPLAHVFARVVQCGAIHSRCRLGYTCDPKDLPADLRTFRPTFLLSVPRTFTRIQDTARRDAHNSGRGGLFDRAERTAVAYSESLDGDGPGVGLRLRHRVFDTLVYARLRAVLGGRCRRAISGGAPLDARLAHFFRGIGVTIYEGYGLTETTSGACLNLEGAHRIGSVGRPLPGTSVRVADDGEVSVAGDLVFRGYWRDPAATAAVLADGWLRTGDLGRLDADGFLFITGRRKDIVVTAGGENVAPAALEDRLRSHPLVSQAMVVGDERPFIGCLVTVDRDSVSDWLARHDRPTGTAVADLRTDPEFRAEIQSAVDDVNRTASRAEQIRRFRILDRDFSEQDGELTPTLKLRRAVILRRYAQDVSALYAPD